MALAHKIKLDQLLAEADATLHRFLTVRAQFRAGLATREQLTQAEADHDVAMHAYTSYYAVALADDSSTPMNPPTQQ
jgi:hypothetical protein